MISFYQIDSIVPGEKDQLRLELCNQVIIQIEEIIFNQLFNLVEIFYLKFYTSKI